MAVGGGGSGFGRDVAVLSAIVLAAASPPVLVLGWAVLQMFFQKFGANLPAGSLTVASVSVLAVVLVLTRAGIVRILSTPRRSTARPPVLRFGRPRRRAA